MPCRAIGHAFWGAGHLDEGDSMQLFVLLLAQLLLGLRGDRRCPVRLGPDAAADLLERDALLADEP
eukprot:10721979-Heterocapsa_arctica.AAC.1